MYDLSAIFFIPGGSSFWDITKYVKTKKKLADASFSSL